MKRSARTRPAEADLLKQTGRSGPAEADQLKGCCLELITPNAAAVMQVGGRSNRAPHHRTLPTHPLATPEPPYTTTSSQTDGWKHVVPNNALMNEVVALLAGAPTGGKSKKRTADQAGLSAEDKEVEEMRGWKVARLREELQGRGLDTKGRKGELVERLERAMKGGSGGGSSSSSSSSSSGSGLGAAQ